MFFVIDHVCEEHLEKGEEEEQQQHHLPPFAIPYGSLCFRRHCSFLPITGSPTQAVRRLNDTDQPLG